MTKFITNKLLVLLTLSLLASCANKKDEDEVLTPPAELYKQGKELLDKKEYKKAADTFSKIYFQHPGSDYAIQAELMEGYALYKGGKYQEAIDVLEAFSKIHPLHKEMPYIQYLKALSYYEQIQNPDKDQSNTSKAKEAFEYLVNKYGDSKYAQDARAKIILLRERLAGQEMEISRYYLSRSNPVAAIGRLNIVRNQYSNTAHYAEALYRLAESYKMLGIDEEARKYASILESQKPDSVWAKRGVALVK